MREFICASPLGIHAHIPHMIACGTDLHLFQLTIFVIDGGLEFTVELRHAHTFTNKHDGNTRISYFVSNKLLVRSPVAALLIVGPSVELHRVSQCIHAHIPYMIACGTDLHLVQLTIFVSDGGLEFTVDLRHAHTCTNEHDRNTNISHFISNKSPVPSPAPPPPPTHTHTYHIMRSAGPRSIRAL